MLTHLADFEKRLRRSLMNREDAAVPVSLAAPRLVRRAK
jgi:hypothetical protein